MIYHIVLFKLRKDLFKEDIDELRNALLQLKKIKNVISISFGTQESMYPGYADRCKGYSHALIVTLKDRESLMAYDIDPLHTEVKTSFIIPSVDSTAENPVLAMDYEFNDPEQQFLDIKVIAKWGYVSAAVLVALFALRSRSRL